ncbi:hypothetical protein [Oleiharenicola sp. Vm1]|uniref:hypothetical protein n=1 Tax=Oleiharenicola sp. Vm1 TaxID=3398393 RepID=UPI0039F63752
MSAAWALLRDVALFLFAVGGLAAPWLRAVRRWPETERLPLALAAALLTGYGAAFAVYLAGLDWRWFWLAPLAGLGLAWHRDTRAALRAPEIRGALLAYAAVALACLGWQSTVSVYSGAAWQVDWWEHYDRAQFFLARWPRDTLFATIYPLPARPPLVNLWAAALLGASGGAYFNYQIFLTLLSTLVVFPLWTLARRLDAAGPRWLVPALLASPLLVQNATFPWTKLAAAFFVLVAWLQLTARDDNGGRLVAAALALAGGMLAHYSTGPWIVALGLAWLLTRPAAAPARQLPLALAGAALVLLSWLGWSLAAYGAATTFTQNTTLALAPALPPAERLAVAATNLAHTVAPFSFGPVEPWLVAQASALGRARDFWFILYQTRAVWMCGLGGAVVLAWLALLRRESPPRRFAVLALPVVVVLGTVVHTQPDAFGLAHIALQPLALLGLAWIAGAAATLPRWLRALWLGGLAGDFAAGIALHFGVQSGWLDRALRGPLAPDALWSAYTRAAQVSYHDKQALHLTFLSDLGAPLLSVALLAAAAALAIHHGRREMTFPAPSPAS